MSLVPEGDYFLEKETKSKRWAGRPQWFLTLRPDGRLCSLTTQRKCVEGELGPYVWKAPAVCREPAHLRSKDPPRGLWADPLLPETRRSQLGSMYLKSSFREPENLGTMVAAQ